MKLKTLNFMNNLQKHRRMAESYLEPFFSFCYHPNVNFSTIKSNVPFNAMEDFTKSLALRILLIRDSSRPL